MPSPGEINWQEVNYMGEPNINVISIKFISVFKIDIPSDIQIGQ